MIPRRSLLVGSVASLSVPLVARFRRYLRAHGQPLIEPPANAPDTLFVTLEGDDYVISLGEPARQLPDVITWRQYLTKRGECTDETKENLERIENDWGVEQHDLDSLMDEYMWYDYWGRAESPTSRAFYLLQELDIGPELADGAKGPGLEFVDGPSPGSDYLAVHCLDALSISLLQHRLREIGSPLAVKYIGEIW